MAKKAQRARTPARIIWDMISAEMQRQEMTQTELARRAKVGKNTVSTDGQDPNKIPMSRVWLYFTILGIDPLTVLRPLAIAHAEKMIELGQDD